MRVAGVVLLFSLWLSGSVAAREWKVTDPETDPKAPAATLLLKIDKSAISLIRESDKAVLRKIAPAEVMAIWYDDYAVRHYGREWFVKIDDLCRDLCGGQDMTVPLTLLAVGGVGYLAARPFEQRQHYANIQYRKGDSFDVVALRTTWLDHFWLMTDLSRAVDKRWLNVPQQRPKLFWSWTDRKQVFEPGSYAGKVSLPAQEHDVLLWEDGKGRGIVMFFSAPGSGTPALLAAEAVTVEKFQTRNSGAEYCRNADKVQQILRVQIGDKRVTLSSAAKSCTASPR